MNGMMDGWMDLNGFEWMNEWDGWMNKSMDEWN
jgi:hypothetical protein